MERSNDLLEKYFRGETTLAEESELKQYFKASNILPEHEMYRALFKAFDEELLEKGGECTIKVTNDQKKTKRMWIQTFIYSGIAASLLLALWVQYPKQPDNYAVVSGNKIQDTEFAEKYTAKKLNQVNDVLTRSMKPMQNIEKVRTNLHPINKLSNVKEKMDELQNKLQFK